MATMGSKLGEYEGKTYTVERFGTRVSGDLDKISRETGISLTLLKRMVRDGSGYNHWVVV